MRIFYIKINCFSFLAHYKEDYFESKILMMTMIHQFERFLQYCDTKFLSIIVRRWDICFFQMAILFYFLSKFVRAME